ncbi:MAG TPA: hypothetical protein VGH28_28860 [Polyangiaceae bacterium]
MPTSDRRRYYVAHFALLAGLAQLTALWACAMVWVAEPWRPAGGFDAVGAALMLSIAILGVGLFIAYALVTSLLAWLVRGHWSALVLDVAAAVAVLVLARS